MNYYLPLAYPDFELSSLAYVRKVEGGVFYNEQNLGRTTNPLYKAYTTYGLDIRFDCNLLRYYLPVFQLGTRVVFFKGGIVAPKLELVLNYSI